MEKKGLPIRKSRAILLTMQMVLTLLLLAVALYLLVFASINHLGGWMIASYVCIIISVTVILLASEVSFIKEISELNRDGKAARNACGRTMSHMI